MTWHRLFPEEPVKVDPLTPESLDQNPAYWRVMDRYGASATDHMATIRLMAESPIEAVLMCCLACQLSNGTVPLRIVKGATLDDIRREPGNTLAAQVPVLGFRVDLVLNRTDNDGKTCTIAIECDGKAFHGEQHRVADERREELLVEHFNGIIRFKGAEIHKDPIRCAERACRLLLERMQQSRVSDILARFRPTTEAAE